MTVEEFELKQSKMSDSELINLCHKEVGELASTYGKSHRMTIPPMVTDTDMLLSELIKRFKMLSEAMRWRDPKEELPEFNKKDYLNGDNKRYLIKVVRGSISTRRYVTTVGWLISANRWNVEMDWVNVIGWRPIE